LGAGPQAPVPECVPVSLVVVRAVPAWVVRARAAAPWA
jgi:hypothetical protein